MKQTIIHDRSIIPDKINHQFRKSIEYHRDREQNLIRHKRYKINHGSTKHKSIYSLAIQSNIIINDLDLNPTRVAQTLQQNHQLPDENPIHNERKSRENSSIGLSKDIKLQRYSRQERSMQKKSDPYDDEFDNLKHNRQKISLLKRIIEHYNVKSFESTYYSNLMNNLGIKVSGGSQLRNRFANVKTNSIKYQKDDSKMVKHERSLKVKHSKNSNSFDCEDFFNNSLMKIQAQSINHLIKYESEEKSMIKRQLAASKQEKVRTSKNLRKANHSIFKAAKKEILRNENISSLKCYDNGQNCINIKVNKYKEFIFIINYGSNIYRELDIEKYQTPFKAYVGFGNNSNLIKAIMKKRFWFEVTKNKEQANFIWTQLKDQEVFSYQSIKYEQNQQKNMIETRDKAKIMAHQHHQSAICFDLEAKQKTISTNMQQSSQNTQSNPQSKREQKNDECSRPEPRTLKVNTKNIEIFNPYSKILANEQSNNYIDLLAEVTYKKRLKFNDRLRYMKGIRYITEEELGYQMVHNHFPLNGLLGNKKAMFYMMKEFCRISHKDIFEIVPLTFHIRNGLMDQQFKEFMKRFNENKAKKRPNYWIMKPGQFSNRGQGISCTSKAEQVRAKINNLKKIGKNKSLILQQYITNPLLYNGRKFDIRTYMLISINNGKLKAYWYQDGYIRTSSYMWRLDQIQDTYIHLTNDAIQKFSSDYGKYQPANKLTYSELQRYLDTLPKPSHTKYSFQNEIYPKLRQIATDAVKASFQYLHPDRKANNFQIFGFDFMIDANFKPWLIQINTNPCLEINCLVLERIIPSMIQNAFRIALDPIFPPPLNYSSTYKYNIPENALHYNKFQLIFDEERDGLRLLDLYRDSKVIQSMEDYEEDKQIYEQQGEEINLEEN